MTGAAPNGTTSNGTTSNGTVNDTNTDIPPEERRPGVPYQSAGFHLMKREIMRPPPAIITLEEHYGLPPWLLEKHNVQEVDAPYPPEMPMMQYSTPRLQLDEGMRSRLADMDRGNIAMQILSLTGDTKFATHEEEIRFAQDVNDNIANEIASSDAPHRFRAFAYLPLRSPKHAAVELERCVTQHGMLGTLICGQIDGKFLDHTDFAPILGKAQDLKVPIYVHPGYPPASVFQAYYGGLPGGLGTVLAACGFGWHAETAIHVQRLVLSGTLDQYPDLNIIAGHHGEMLPMMLQRMDNMYKNLRPGKRSVSQTIREQVYITFSGMYTVPLVKLSIEQFGVDHTLWSCDYPWLPAEDTRGFFRVLNDVLHPTDLRKICQTNAEKLLNFQFPVEDQIREMVIEDEKEIWMAKKKAKELRPTSAAATTDRPNTLQVS